MAAAANKVDGEGAPQALKRVALIGNPNVGKSVIFGLLTGKYTTVSNYPGTTVEVSYGNISLDGNRFLLVDTPGVNSLLPMSEDEKVTRDILLAERPAVVVQVGDAKNLKRTLVITIQLAEMGLPVVLDLNMEDESRDKGISIDKESLSSLLGISVIGTVAPEKKGIKDLNAAILRGSRAPSVPVNYGPVVEEYAKKIAALLPPANISRRSIAFMVLAGDGSLAGWLKTNLDENTIEAVEALRDECAVKTGRSVGLHINEARLRRASVIAESVIHRSAEKENKFMSFIGQASMHPLWGLPILLLVLFCIYEFVGVFGAGTLVNFFEKIIFGRYLNPMFTKLVDTLVPIQFVRDLIVGQYGIITMALTYAIAIILPITTTFFIAFAILEDSGYLPRLAVMSNRVFNIMGLSGKAVLPMILGLGCGTMAVMTTRILESRRDRLIATFLLALAIPCSAQLGVILGMLSSLSAMAMAIWIMCVLVVLLFSGFLAAKILPGKRSEFFLEIPPLRKPALANVALKTMNRAVWYLKEAVPLFVLGTLVLFALDKLSLIQVIEKASSPVIVGFLGLPEKATESFIIGFLRRDYGAAGLFALSRQGLLTPVQSLVSLVTITLFIPCLASFFMIIKERGIRTAVSMLVIITPVALAFGGALNWVLRRFNIGV
ncbi:MAG: ferrous iron transport protein B [Nitrospiraceae bacterium]|nr:ferrous iron transport protein B [Nitrospiraceae bacterium]